MFINFGPLLFKQSVTLATYYAQRFFLQFSHNHLMLSRGQVKYEIEQNKMQIILALCEDCTGLEG